MQIKGRIITGAIVAGVLIGAAGGTYAIANTVQDTREPVVNSTPAETTQPTVAPAETYQVASPTPTPTVTSAPVPAATESPAPAPAAPAPAQTQENHVSDTDPQSAPPVVVDGAVQPPAQAPSIGQESSVENPITGN